MALKALLLKKQLDNKFLECGTQVFDLIKY